MSVPFFSIRRENVSTDEFCPHCLDGTHNDGGASWVAHKDVTNPVESKRGNLIHPIHKKCAEEVHEVYTKCLGQDVYVDKNSLIKCTDISDDVHQAIKDEKNNDSTRESFLKWGRIGALICISASIAMVVPAIFFGIVPLMIASAVLGGLGLVFGISFQLSKSFFTTIDYELLRDHESKFINYIKSSTGGHDRLKAEGIRGLANEFANILKA